MNHILFVEDEPSVQEFVADALAAYRVGIARNVAEALAYLKANQVDLLLLDLQLGADNGMTIARYIREQSPHIAIVILTGQGSLKSAIQAIELNAQAYLLKPVSPDELEAVIEEQIAKMRDMRQRDMMATHMKAAVRSMQNETHDRMLVSGSLRLDWGRFEAMYDGQDLQLSSAQFRVLWMLVENAGQAVSSLELARDGLGYNVNASEAGDLIKGYIFELRRKLAAFDAGNEHIRTMRGYGYLWMMK